MFWSSKPRWSASATSSSACVTRRARVSSRPTASTGGTWCRCARPWCGGAAGRPTRRCGERGSPVALDQERWTLKTQEAVRGAVERAHAQNNPEVTPDHILAALLGQADGLALPLLAKAGV